MNLTLFVLALIGCASVILGVYALLRRPGQTNIHLQAGEIRVADIVELRGIAFRNFLLLFSDADYRAFRQESKLLRLARTLRKERRLIALTWLKAVQSDLLALWRLRRLLVSYGVSQGPAMESLATVRVLCMLFALIALRISVFAFGPFAVRGIVLRCRRQIEFYTRSCQAALWRLPKHQWPQFSTEWRSRHVLAA